jgi:threonine synthase
MQPLKSSIVCGGCGARAPDTGMPPYRCPRASEPDDVDHVLSRRLDPAQVGFPAVDDDNPFVAFRTLFASHHRALAGGLEDAAWVDRIRALDRKIAEIDGHGFAITPFGEQPALGAATSWPGRLWIKDETDNVSGSHKSRHLMGVLAYLETVADPADRKRPLAISSCGNAALAAAVVARAADRQLLVYVPGWANPRVLERLHQLGAELKICERDPSVPGDPCTAAFRKAVAAGAIPFSCQGTDNGLVVEGGMTLAYEMIARLQHAAQHLFVQVGGGALASACYAAWADAVRWRVTPELPALHAVQTDAVAPLARAWKRLMRRLLPQVGYPRELPSDDDSTPPLDQAHDWARFVCERRVAPVVEATLRYAATHRSQFMWPWERAPSGLASGILDDETYDWLAVTRGMLRSGGFPIVVTNDTIDEANRLARAHTPIAVDHTGSAGLAGLLALVRAGLAKPEDDAIVLFTGKDRAAERTPR